MAKNLVLYEIRCQQCKKLLGKLLGTAEIKCKRCSFINRVSVQIEDHRIPN